ncbi:putative nephrocystin-3 [Sesbania bispinosa]|nr:putative nephrocystin-3 [Sesbania bispinosa]
MWLRILPGYLRLTSTQDPQLCSFSASSVPEVQLSQYGPALENLATLRLFQQSLAATSPSFSLKKPSSVPLPLLCVSTFFTSSITQISCLEASEEGNEHSSSSVALATETVSFPMLQESSPDSSSTPLEEKNEFEKHSVLYFMPEIRKECVIKLEWKSSPDPFIFGDFEFHTVKELQRILDSPGDHQDPRVGETFHYLDEANVRAMQFDKAEELCKKTLKIYRAHSEPVSLKKVVDRRAH